MAGNLLGPWVAGARETHADTYRHQVTVKWTINNKISFCGGRMFSVFIVHPRGRFVVPPQETETSPQPPAANSDAKTVRGCCSSERWVGEHTCRKQRVYHKGPSIQPAAYCCRDGPYRWLLYRCLGVGWIDLYLKDYTQRLRKTRLQTVRLLISCRLTDAYYARLRLAPARVISTTSKSRAETPGLKATVKTLSVDAPVTLTWIIKRQVFSRTISIDEN